jgi:CheY-like chemotaxis protein
MPPEVLAHVFEPFFTTKAFGSGTGLGLPLARGLIGAMGGDLSLESQVAGGTTARIALPEDAAIPGQPPAGALGLLPGPLRLLLVDDNATVLSSLARVLAHHFLVRQAAGVTDALRCAATEPIDLVLCDVMMPNGGGQAFLDGLRQCAPRLALKVVFLTGGATSDQARSFLDGQHQPVLSKPLDVSELMRAAQSLLQAPGDNEAAADSCAPTVEIRRDSPPQ